MTDPSHRHGYDLGPLAEAFLDDRLGRLSLVPECEDCGAPWVERGVKHWRPDGSQLCWWLVMDLPPTLLNDRTEEET